MKKVIALTDVVERIPNGAVLMIGGFAGIGVPLRLVDELVRQRKNELTIITNDTGWPNLGVGKLISERLVSRVIASHIGLNPDTQKQMIAGAIQVELVPQGTLAERIRAGGFGLGGVLTLTGLGTLVEEGKQTVDVDGETFLLEKPLRADFALVAAKRADYGGNLEYAFTARNFNPLMAMAATTVIAEAEEIVPVGVIAPDAVVTPNVVVDHLVAKERRHG